MARPGEAGALVVSGAQAAAPGGAQTTALSGAQVAALVAPAAPTALSGAQVAALVAPAAPTALSGAQAAAPSAAQAAAPTIALMKTFATEGAEAAVQDALSRLGFIARLKPGERVDVATHGVQADTLYQRASRAVFARGETRETTRTFIAKTIDDAFALACDYLAANTEFGRLIGGRILEALVAAKPGVLSLSTTYASDRMFVARLQSLVELLDIKIASIGWRPPVAPAGMYGAAPLVYT